jgi:hypothetical protein
MRVYAHGASGGSCAAATSHAATCASARHLLCHRLSLAPALCVRPTFLPLCTTTSTCSSSDFERHCNFLIMTMLLVLLVPLAAASLDVADAFVTNELIIVDISAGLCSTTTTRSLLPMPNGTTPISHHDHAPRAAFFARCHNSCRRRRRHNPHPTVIARHSRTFPHTSSSNMHSQPSAIFTPCTSAHAHLLPARTPVACPRAC